MHFKNIEIQNYRNIHRSVVHFNEHLNILIGENGQGKTNLIEALYLLSQGESFRYSEKTDLIEKGFPSSSLKTEIEVNELSHYLSCHLEKENKKHFLMKKQINTVLLKSKFPLILFSPESLLIIKDNSEKRRNLIDQFLMTQFPKSQKIILDFKKALKARNTLLKNNKIKPLPSFFHSLRSLDEIYHQLSIQLTLMRLEAIHHIQPELIHAFKFLTQEKNVDISVEISFNDDHFKSTHQRENIVDAMHKQSQLRLEKEIQLGMTISGPHRHEINFLYHGNNSRFFCSQGQQRAIILSFKIAQIVYHRKVHGFYPVLLLDDVLSELDLLKRKTLVSFLNELKTQVFLTTTDLSENHDFNVSDANLIQVKNGIFNLS